jgi:hypothetical protein
VVPQDGIADLICHFRTQALALTPWSTEACLTARLANAAATPFTGCDSVRIVPPGGIEPPPHPHPPGPPWCRLDGGPPFGLALGQDE